jgi:purine-binding chemotaxis protein CheW
MWQERLEELRAAFDRSFAEAPRDDRPDHEDLVTLRCAGELYAVRLRHVSALVTDKNVTPLPDSVAELLGIAGFRGTLVPVYDLGAVLGHGATRTARWLLLTAVSPRVALAFESFQGHLRVATAAAVPDATRKHVEGLVPRDGGLVPVLSVASVLKTIQARVEPRKET